MSILPENFIAHYQQILGESRAEKFFEYCQKPLKKCVRVNTLKYSVEKFLDEGKKRNWDLEPIPWCKDGFYLERDQEDRNALGNLLMHTAGGIYVQEASSMLPVEALFMGHENEDFTGKILCDVASSPGSKTTQIASQLNNNGLLIANEISSSRLKALYSNIERCGVENIILTNYDGENLCSMLPQMLDYILLDAPCTGEGTVRKDRNALKNWQPHDAVTISHLQKKLIVSAFNALKQGGELVYSTCTLAKEENQEVVEYLQEKFPDEVEIISLENLFPGAEKSITPEGFLHIWPEIYDSEGFFVAKVRRKNAPRLEEKKVYGKSPYEKLSKKQTAEVQKFFRDTWGFILPEDRKCWKKENTIWLFPARSEEIFSRIKGDRIGIPLVTIHKKGWVTHHEAAVSLGKNFTKNTFEVSEEESSKIFKGEDLSFLDPSHDGNEILAMHKDFPLSLGKAIKTKWKNRLPRVLVRNNVQW